MRAGRSTRRRGRASTGSPSCARGSTTRRRARCASVPACHLRRADREPLASLLPGAGPGGAHGRVAADPQRGDDRRQRRHLLAGRRRAARARRARRRRAPRSVRRRAATCRSPSSWSAPKRTALQPGELIAGVTVPVLDGWQGYTKVGVRNAMVIAIAERVPRRRPARRGRSASRSARSARRSCARAEAEALAARRGRLGRLGRARRRRRARSARWPPRRAARSTTTARPRPTDGRRSRCSPRRLLRRAFPTLTDAAHVAADATWTSSTRCTSTATDREVARRVGRREPAVRAARAARPARQQGRVRAGRVRLVQRARRRRAGVPLPRARGQRGRPADRHGRGPRRAGRADRRAAGVRRRRRGAVRVLHARADRGRARAARPHPRSRPSSRSARSSPATSAAAPATGGSSTPCSGSPSRGGADGAMTIDVDAATRGRRRAPAGSATARRAPTAIAKVQGSFAFSVRPRRPTALCGARRCARRTRTHGSCASTCRRRGGSPGSRRSSRPTTCRARRPTG